MLITIIIIILIIIMIVFIVKNSFKIIEGFFSKKVSLFFF